jgi:hypothetical protein
MIEHSKFGWKRVGWQEMSWGGVLILSKAQKSAGTSAQNPAGDVLAPASEFRDARMTAVQRLLPVTTGSFQEVKFQGFPTCQRSFVAELTIKTC